MSLKFKMLALIVFMGLLPACGTPLTFYYLNNLSKQQELATSTLVGQATLERINGIVFAVVMDSRGIYMSADKDKAKPFGDGMMKNLGELGQQTESLAQNALEAERTAITDAVDVIAEFTKFRTEMVRLSRDVSPEAARLQGDNDANRTNRSALNKVLSDLSQRYAQHAAANLANATSARTQMITAILVLSSLPVLAIFIGLALILRGFAQPLDRIKASILTLAAGNTAATIYGTGRKDEIGAIATAMLVFQHNIIETEKMRRDAELQRVRDEEVRRETERATIEKERAMVVGSIGVGLSKLAARDLTARLTEQLPAAYVQLQQDFNHALEQLETALKVVRTSTDQISFVSEEMSSAADNLSRRSEQQAASLEETAAAVEEITQTVKNSADGALHARRVVETSQATAERTGAVVRSAIGAMADIEQSSTKISQIIGVIDEIAFQTNLLALNAGVEAARAGDAGRGFSVVASEVRALAQRSADAAKEIKVLISTSTSQVDQGVELVDEAGKALDEIIGQVGAITAIMGDIANGAQEQSDGLGQINIAINQMDQTTQQNAAMVEESTAATHALKSEALELAEIVRTFNITGANAPSRSASKRPKGAGASAAKRPMTRSSISPALAAREQPDDWTSF